MATGQSKCARQYLRALLQLAEREGVQVEFMDTPAQVEEALGDVAQARPSRRSSEPMGLYGIGTGGRLGAG